MFLGLISRSSQICKFQANKRCYLKEEKEGGQYLRSNTMAVPCPHPALVHTCVHAPYRYVHTQEGETGDLAIFLEVQVQKLIFGTYLQVLSHCPNVSPSPKAHPTQQQSLPSLCRRRQLPVPVDGNVLAAYSPVGLGDGVYLLVCCFQTLSRLEDRHTSFLILLCMGGSFTCVLTDGCLSCSHYPLTYYHGCC